MFEMNVGLTLISWVMCDWNALSEQQMNAAFGISAIDHTSDCVLSHENNDKLQNVYN